MIWEHSPYVFIIQQNICLRMDRTEYPSIKKTRARIQSRHVSAKKYFLRVSFNDHTTPINGRYCQCKVRSRTVGCCAPVAAVLWYLVSKTRDGWSFVRDKLVLWGRSRLFRHRLGFWCRINKSLCTTGIRCFVQSA